MSQLVLNKKKSKFTVIGGIYREICIWPHWDQLFGSGLRGAAVWASFNEPNTIGLTTWCTKGEEKEIELRAKTFGINLQFFERQQPIEFQYEYPLARPFQYPAIIEANQDSQIELEIDSGLLYGILESNPKIIAKELVWDPQAGSKAPKIGSYTHSVEKLAIILNRIEALAMLEMSSNDLTETEKLSTVLREKTGAEVIVIKDGPFGAWVASKLDTNWIPCFKTDEVFSIGSGDVFSSAFAVAWIQNNQSPASSALFASKATAHYCLTRDINIPKEDGFFQNEGATKQGNKNQKSIYLAGPLFNVPERWFVRQVAEHFRSMGISVFSPLEDVGYLSNEKAIAEADLEGLRKSSAIFLLADGLDSGTLFEAGFSTALKIPIFIYSEKTRKEDLTMLLGTDATLFRDLTTAIYWTAWKLNSND